MGESLDVHFTGPRVSSGALGPVVLNIYGVSPDVPDLQRLAEAQCATHARRGRPILVLSLVLAQLELPGAQARQEATRLRTRMKGVVAASATVIPHSGFWAAAAIGMVNTIALASRNGSAFRTFREPGDAASWLVDFDEALDTASGSPAPFTTSVLAALSQLEREARAAT